MSDTTRDGDGKHEFVLLIAGFDEMTEDMLDALFEAGCDDSTVGSHGGQNYMDFAREAPSFKDAVLSAIADVRKANVGATVMRVDTPTIVSEGEIAQRIGCSRQVTHQYVTGTRGPGGFPAPTSNVSNAPLWRWADVATWLKSAGISADGLEKDLGMLSVINNALEAARIKREDAALFEEVARAIAET